MRHVKEIVIISTYSATDFSTSSAEESLAFITHSLSLLIHITILHNYILFHLLLLLQKLEV